MSKTYSKTRILVECALMIAIGTVLSNIKIFTMPNGGSVTLLSMLPFVLVSFRHGVKWGLFTGLVNGWASGHLRPRRSSISWAKCCWTIWWPLWHWAWQSCLPVRSRTGWSAWPWVPLWQASCGLCAASCPVSLSGAT